MATVPYRQPRNNGSEPLDKPLPHNIDAERTILGAILLDAATPNVALKAATDQIAASDFFHAHHEAIFRRMLKMADSSKPIFLVSMTDELQSNGELEKCGGVGYIATLIDGVPDRTNVGHYAAIVKAKSRLRRLAHIGQSISARALESREDPEALEALLREGLRDLPAIHSNGNGHRKPYYKLMDFLHAEFPVPEHLVEGLIPAHGGSVLVVAMPHRLKSFLTTGLALGCTQPGEKVLGCLTVKKPVRTMLVQVEEHEGDLKGRIRSLMSSAQFLDCDPDAVGIIGREQFDEGFTPSWAKWLREQCVAHRADMVVMDVLRRFFVGRGDLNSPGDSADFLEEIDRIRDLGISVILVHHENRKDAELMAASAGSYNFPGWANVVIQLKRKTEHGQGDDRMTSVEIEADNKLGQAPEALRLVLQLNSPHAPLRLEEIGEGEDWHEAKDQLGEEWSIKDLTEVYGIHRTNALRRLKKWIAKGIAEKIHGGKRGRFGGQARYCWTESLK